VNMKQIVKSLLSVALVVLVAFLGFVIYGNYQQNKLQTEAELSAQATPTPTIKPAEKTPAPPPDPLAEPKNAANVSLAVCGDIVCHAGLNAEAKKADGTYDYTPIFTGAAETVKNADYAICTMETTFPDTTAYSGYPMFKSPPELAAALKSTGFDMVNTASNHSMDGLKNGLNRTLDILDKNGLDHVGTYRTQEERDKNNGIVVKEINGVSFAFLSFTYGTNGIPTTGFEYAVNIFFNDYLTTLSDINYARLKADMAAARALNTDVIAVIMHWGNEYAREPIAYQTELADFMFKEGADLILGGHVHVPEPMELRRVVDNEGNEKTGFIAYCLGNLVSCQEDRYTNLTAALDIDLQKNLDTGETYIKHVSYTPMFMVDLVDHNLKSDWRYRLWNLNSAIASYESGDNLGIMDAKLYNSLLQGREDLHGVMNPQFDIAGGGIDVRKWTLENAA
ncbi:MAG: CapA family protein, partial [Oscillospiraceae bacterium]